MGTPTNYPKGIVTAELLNVRNIPSISGSQIVGSRSKGNQVTIYQETDGWYRIGPDQWVSATYVQKEGSVPSTPIPTPSSTPNWERCIAFVRRWEGGYVNHPSDTGSHTNKGITLATFTAWRHAKGKPTPTVQELKDLSDAEANQIFFERYWLPSKANQMSWPMCLAHFDLAVNGGVARANEAYAACGADFWRYMVWRRDWYRRLETFPIFGKAWINRCKDLILVAYE
jgi:hypothetical protein